MWRRKAGHVSLNSPNLSDLLKFSFKYQQLLRERILNQHRNSRPRYGEKEFNSHILHTMIAWSGWSDSENSCKLKTALDYIYPGYYCFNHINRRLRNLGLFHRLCENHYRWQPVCPQGPEEICLSLEHQSPSKTSKKWVILIALQFRYTLYRPQTKRLRARKIGFFGTSGDVPCAGEDMACGHRFSKVDHRLYITVDL